MSAPYLSQLRSGTRTDTSAATLVALANIFQIKPAYFTDEEYYERLDKICAQYVPNGIPLLIAGGGGG